MREDHQRGDQELELAETDRKSLKTLLHSLPGTAITVYSQLLRLIFSPPGCICQNSLRMNITTPAEQLQLNNLKFLALFIRQ